MILHTASEVITLSRKLENDSANFYDDLARRYPGAAETFLSFARENRKNIGQIERVYYGVITDAIEGGFAFNINPENYSFVTEIRDGTEYTDVLDQARLMERSIVEFYVDAAEQSKSLMADVPRAFMAIARKRENRLSKLA
jgi:hypothetical protein